MLTRSIFKQWSGFGNLYFDLRPREASLGFAKHQSKTCPTLNSIASFFYPFHRDEFGAGVAVPPVPLLLLQLRLHQQKLFHLPVSVLGASPISLAGPTTDSPYLFLQLCCKNKITKPIKLLTAQLNTSQLCCSNPPTAWHYL